MSDKSSIEWCDASWNPVTGCTKVSAGCDHCYAETFAERWRGIPGHYFERGFDVQLRPDKLTLPLRWRKPRKVFVNSMSDLFHESVPDEYIAKVFVVMGLAERHTFQLLTKRHGRMRSLLSQHDRWNIMLTEALSSVLDDADAAIPAVDVDRVDMWLRAREYRTDPLPPLANVWLGCSVENQQWADLRIPALLDTPAAVRFLSCEPLLGPVNLARWLDTPLACGCGAGPAGAPDAIGCCAGCMTPEPSGIDWVIAGGESGIGARPVDLDWVRALRDECQQAKVPFLFKQVGGRTPKAGGRELDGRTWDEFPAVAA